MGTLWRSCAKLRESIEMPFSVVIMVDRGYGVHIPNGKGRFWRFFAVGLNGIFGCTFKTEMYPTRAQKVYNISVWAIHQFILLFKMYFVTRSKSAFTRNVLKCNGDFTKKLRLAATLTRG